MKIRSRCSLGIVVLAVVLFLLPSLGHAVTEITVTNMTELTDAVITANASSGDFDIRLAAGEYRLTGGLLNLDRQLLGTVRFIGDGRDNTKIDGNETSAVFVLANRNFEFENLTIQNGNSGTRSGGGVTQYQGRVTLRNVAIKGNHAADGGGIYCFATASGRCTLNIYDSMIYDNWSSSGASSGAGIYVTKGALVLDGSTLSDNHAPAGKGGGLFIMGASVVKITNSTIDINEASYGAGIDCSNSTLDVVNSTISNNIGGTSIGGGGISATGSCTASIASSTITGNSRLAVGGAGGVYVDSTSTLAMKNTILASNTLQSGTASDCTGNINSGGYNFIGNVNGCTGTVSTDITTGVPILLGTLAVNGGLTRTHMPLLGSPAIDAGNPDGCTDNANVAILTDQRGVGFARIANGKCDIGAVEVFCGDSVVGGNEQCDDGNDVSTDACISCVAARCGDEIVQVGVEDCDDRNVITEKCDYTLISCQVCDETCHLISGAASFCGDGITQPEYGEACDDGNGVQTDECTNACQPARCGDGIVRTGIEVCDDGGANNTRVGGCNANCDGLVSAAVTPPVIGGDTTTAGGDNPRVGVDELPPETPGSSGGGGGGGGGCSLVIR